MPKRVRKLRMGDPLYTLFLHWLYPSPLASPPTCSARAGSSPAAWPNLSTAHRTPWTPLSPQMPFRVPDRQVQCLRTGIFALCKSFGCQLPYFIQLATPYLTIRFPGNLFALKYVRFSTVFPRLLVANLAFLPLADIFTAR